MLVISIIWINLVWYITDGMVISNKTELCSIIDCLETSFKDQQFYLKCVPSIPSSPSSSCIFQSEESVNQTRDFNSNPCLSIQEVIYILITIQFNSSIQNNSQFNKIYSNIQFIPKNLFNETCQNSFIFLIYPSISKMIQINSMNNLKNRSNDVNCSLSNIWTNTIQDIPFDSKSNYSTTKFNISNGDYYDNLYQQLTLSRSQLETFLNKCWFPITASATSLSTTTTFDTKSSKKINEDEDSKEKVTILVPIVIICFVVFSCVLIMRFCHDGESSLMIQAKVMKYHPEKDKQLLSIIYQQIHKETAELKEEASTSQHRQKSCNHQLNNEIKKPKNSKIDKCQKPTTTNATKTATTGSKASNKVVRDKKIPNTQPCCSKDLSSCPLVSTIACGLAPIKK